MASKVDLILYDRCQPEKCNGGVCAAAAACPHKLLRQEVPHEAPVPHPSMCRACGDCVRACPSKAVQIVAM